MVNAAEPAVRSFLSLGTRLWEPFARTVQARRLVLCFHSVQDGECPDRGYVSRRLRMDVDAFEEVLEWLQEWASLMTLGELMKGEGDGWRVALTFDDGYVDNLNTVLPLLEQYQVPMTWFICTRYVQEPQALPWWDLIDYAESHVRDRLAFSCAGERFEYDLRRPGERKRLRREQRPRFYEAQAPARRQRQSALADAVRESTGQALPSNGFARPHEAAEAADSPWITIGAHTHTHQNLGVCSEAEVAHEVEHGRSLLEEWTGQSGRWLAYPFGGPSAWTQEVARQVENQGLAGAFTLTPDHVGSAPHRFAIPRIDISPQWGIAQARTRIFGTDLFRWARTAKACIQ